MMPQHTTIAYLTNRRAPMVEWFLDSLHRELGGDYGNVRIVIVDFYADEPGRRDAFAKAAHSEIIHVTPKPSSWCGKHRYTSKNYFDAAGARNTAICYAPDGFLVFVDDLSVLLPGWIRGVQSAIAGRYVVQGAYKKVRDLVVSSGNIVSFTENPSGVDCRWTYGNDLGPVPGRDNQCYGCSFGAPIEAFLATNGQDEAASGMGFEDVLFGIALAHHGWRFMYDRRMATYESEERHFVEDPFPKRNVENVQGTKDMAWALLIAVSNGSRKVFPNYFPEGGIAVMRQHILNGGSFPVPPQPMHCWATGEPLNEL